MMGISFFILCSILISFLKHNIYTEAYHTGSHKTEILL